MSRAAAEFAPKGGGGAMILSPWLSWQSRLTPGERKPRRGMQMRWWLIGLLLVPVAAHAEPCCGQITPQGRQLAQFLDGSGVDHLWIAGWHIDWATGEADREDPGGPEAKTHCSAFAAAMAERVHVYLLRPPDHAQALLANAQTRWLRDHGAEQGWQELATPVEAQSAANSGALVLEAFENPDPFH